MAEGPHIPKAPFTVAICTRDRASFLKLCLNALLESADDRTFPILVINNGSTDDTSDLLGGFLPRIRIVDELRPGLSIARNRAIEACETEYLVFLDDDGIPSKTWVSAVADITVRGAADLFGGPYSPFYTSPKPHWFNDAWGTGHSDLDDGPQPFPICFSGGNMGWRVSLLKEFGGFDPSLGMVGKALRLGEETALQIAIRKKHAKAVFEFSSAMHMCHHVPTQKMTLSYIHQRNFVYGRQLKDIDPEGFAQSRSLKRFLTTSKFGLPLLLRLVIRDRKRYPYWKGFAAQYLSLNSILLGTQSRAFSDGIASLRNGLGWR